MGRWKVMLATALLLMGLLVAAFLLDHVIATSNSQWFLGAIGAVGILAAGVAGAKNRRAECLLPLLPFAAVLTLLSLTDTSPLKPFARFYAAIEPGMTEAEVLKTLDAQFPPTGRYPRPLVNRRLGPKHLGFILDPRDGRYDAEMVALDFEAGRVATKRYYPD
ncbi:MAG TPA: hypothetical protein VH643_14650 [Gemmataceae bacterium]|jgi:hypothetical protein